MPSYDFRNKETNEIFEKKMSYRDLDQFLIDNPNFERYHTPENIPVLGDGMRMNVPGIGQPRMDFEQGVIQRIKDNVPGNTLNKSHKTKMPREW